MFIKICLKNWLGLIILHHSEVTANLFAKMLFFNGVVNGQVLNGIIAFYFIYIFRAFYICMYFFFNLNPKMLLLFW